MFLILFYLCLAQNMCEKKDVISLVQIVFSNMNPFPFKLSIRLEGTTHTILSYELREAVLIQKLAKW